MAVQIRRVTDADIDPMVRSDYRSFGVALSEVPKGVERVRGGGIEVDRFFVADDEGSIVGTGGACTMELTLPGGGFVPISGVTWISVAATHRRQGIMRRVMDALVDDARDRGEVAGALLASEGSIYANVGYGPATTWQTTAIDTRRVSWTSPRPTGRLRFVDPADALDVLPAVHDRVRAGRVGEVSRNPTWWKGHVATGRQAVDHFVVYADESGVDQAYAAYKIEERWVAGGPNHLAEVLYAGAATPEAQHAIWRFLCELDLVGEVTTEALGPDEPLHWQVADARQFRTTEVTDMLWLRLLDVSAFLAARRYRVSDELVIEVSGGDRGVAGRYRLAGGPDGAKCEPTGDAAEVTLTAPDLASISLGGHTARVLGAAGRIREDVPGCAGRLSDMFSWDPSPYCATNF
jgi:predicted acetyltransferase